MRLALRIVGGLALLLGTWWILQGTGLAPIGFMANVIEWAYRGGVLAAVGALLVAGSFFVGRRKP